MGGGGGDGGGLQWEKLIIGPFTTVGTRPGALRAHTERMRRARAPPSARSLRAHAREHGRRQARRGARADARRARATQARC